VDSHTLKFQWHVEYVCEASFLDVIYFATLEP
jgi:hypothetical protein